MTAAAGWIEEIGAAYRRGESIRRRLPGGGVLVLERPLPFLIVQRVRGGLPDDATPRLSRTEAAHLVWRGGADEADASAGADGDDVPSAGGQQTAASEEPAAARDADILRRLVRTIVEAGVERHGSFLLLELWAGEGRAFRVRAPEEEAPATVRGLAEELSHLWELDRSLSVEILPSETRSPPGEPPLLTVPECYRLGVLLLGLEIPPVYVQPDGGPFPLFFRGFREGVSRALRRAAFEFARVETEGPLTDWRALGPREVDATVWQADRALAEIAGSFDFLLLVSPVNESEAWFRFQDSGSSTPPDFRYRLLPVDPDLLKRRLYAIELEKVEDPALSFLLRDRREELDRKLSMLGERGTRDFLYGSFCLYRPVEESLISTALSLLDAIPPAEPTPPEVALGATDFVAAAEREFEFYRGLDPRFAAEAQIRPDVSGAMVSGSTLLVDERLLLDSARLDALVQHEVGTHLLTYHNGTAQPLRQLARGLAGYDELQEALGVFAEYLAGGITPRRMRILAARVVAAHAVERGADFMETFRALRDDHGMRAAEAFDVAARAHHSGGLTRDAIYLRGLAALLEYLAGGGDLQPLYMGKLALRHLDAVLELRDRGILLPPVLLPRILESPAAGERLEAARAGLRLIETVRNRGRGAA